MVQICHNTMQPTPHSSILITHSFTYHVASRLCAIYLAQVAHGSLARPSLRGAEPICSYKLPIAKTLVDNIKISI